jgi:hypothetical protein
MPDGRKSKEVQTEPWRRLRPDDPYNIMAIEYAEQADNEAAKHPPERDPFYGS